jgi:hypothetical protein
MIKFVNYLVILISVCFAPFAIARELFIIPNLFISSRNFEYSVADGGVDGTINSIGLGVTTTYKNFYIDVSGEVNPTTNEESTIRLFTDRVNFDRSDFAASMGYAVNDSISIFAGYKYGKTTIAEAASAKTSPLIGAKISLEGQGGFIGAGGIFPVKDWGFLSFSTAYATMKATYQDVIVDESRGDASGTSLGVKWKGHFSESLSYELSMIRHDYYYKNFDKLDSDISEQIFSVRFGLSYRF